MDPISIEDCINGNAYYLTSRNLIVGVYIEATSGFVGIREKFGSEYLFTEYHWDIGPPSGTARPYVDLGSCPVESLDEYHRATYKGDGSDPEWATPPDYLVTNRELFDWLKELQDSLAIPCNQCGEPYWPSPDPDRNDGFCMRTVCWDSRCLPCPQCGAKVLDSDGTKLCWTCEDPERAERLMEEARQRIDKERAERNAQ